MNQRRNVIVLAAVLLILTSVCRVPLASPVRLSFQLLFQISVALMLAYGIWWKGNKWLPGILILGTVSCFYPKFTIVSFYTFQVIVFGAMWYLILVHCLKRQYVSILLDAMCILAICNVIYQGIQIAGYDFIYNDIGKAPTTQAVGFMSNRNELGALLAFCLPAFFRRGWVWVVPVTMAGLIVTHCMGGVLAAGAITVVFLFWYLNTWMKITVALTCILFAALYGVFIDTHFDTSRLTAWGLMWELYKSNWITGYGLGSFQTIFMGLKEYFVTPYAQAHNDLFQGVFEMGAGFAVLTVGYFVSIIRRINKRAILSLAAITGIVINSLVNFPFHVATTAMVAVTWMAILDNDLRSTH